MGWKKSRPEYNILLGRVDYSGNIWYIYNVNGKARFVARGSTGLWMDSSTHIGSGYMLRKLGFDVNAGGGIFRPRTMKRKTFRGLNKRQIINLQRVM